MKVFKKDFADIQLGEIESLVKKITFDDVKKFADMSGDNNPLHVDRIYAESTPFKDIVAHGMLGASFISTIIGTRLPGEGALWMSQSFNFLLPVRIGDELTVSCKVLKKYDRERMLDLEASIVNQNQEVVLSGEGRVRVLESRAPQKTASTELSKVAIVTGGAGGIGRAICRKLAIDGFAVVINYRTSADRAIALREEIIAAGGRAVEVQADVTNPKDVTSLIQKAQLHFGAVGVLVNNASAKISPKSFENLEWADLSGQLDSHLKSAYLLSKGCVAAFKEQGRGKIISITSQVLDANPSTTWTAYAVGKASLSTFSKYLAAELGPHQITVNCVSPGMTDTSLICDTPEKMRLIVARQTPLRRLAQPADVAGAVAFLASKEADFITGETIRVNGGQVML